MAHKYLQQQLECFDTTQDDESLEDYIEEEEVEVETISTIFSNKLINLGLSALSEKKKEEHRSATQVQKDSTHLQEIQNDIAYLQTLSARQLKDEIETNAEVGDEGLSGVRSGLNPQGITKTMTFYSPNSPQRRDSQSSTGLPSYVQKMMEKDASLRRLLKNGCVTISQISEPAQNDRKSMNDITVTKTSGEVLHNIKSEWSGLNDPTVNQDPLASWNSDSELDWSNYPFAQKFLHLVRIATTGGEGTEQNRRKTVETNMDTYSLATMLDNTKSSTSSKHPPPKFRKLIPKPYPGFTPPPPNPKLANVRQKPTYQTIGRTMTPKPRIIAPRPSSSSKQSRVEEEIDPTKFLEVSLLEEDHATVSDEHRRKYKCPHCPKAFCWSTDLKRHILTHTGERPFKCIYCSANFTRKFLMQKHVRKYHPGMDYETPGKLSNNQSVSNGTKNGTTAANGVFLIPRPEMSEIIIAEDEYEDGGEGYFDQDNYEDITYEDGSNLVSVTDDTAFEEQEYEEEGDEAPGSQIILKEEMLEDYDDEENDCGEEFADPEQFFEEDECEVEEVESLEDVNPEQIQEQNTDPLEQKYSFEHNNKLTVMDSSRSSSPIVINVFSSSAPISERSDEGRDFDQTESSSTAPRRLSQSLVKQLVRASAKLKGEMAKTTSAREALRLLVRR